jgi:hypothetical protein
MKKPPAAAPVFFLLCSWAVLALAGEAGEGGVTAQVGRSQIRLIPPAGLQQIDGLDQEVDQALAGLTAPGVELLAVYAEPQTWRAFRDGLNHQGPGTSLDFYAYIATPEALANEDVTPADFGQFKELTLRYNHEAAVLDDQPRYLTYRTSRSQMNAAGRTVQADQITTLILVEGRVLALNTFSNDQNRIPTQFADSALGWRDAYWRLTSPAASAK